jgi:SPP1 gp7 family putative phage head morphogenesis protein
MLELEFGVFWKHYERQKRIRTEDFRRLHYDERPDRFVLYLKSVDYWEYITVLKKEDLARFGNQYDGEDGVRDFKRMVLFDAVPLKQKEIEVLGLEAVQKPFAGYSSFDDCVRKNRDKRDPEAYCASIMRRVEGGKSKEVSPEEKPLGESNAKDYAGFLRGEFKSWEESILRAVDRDLKDESVEKDYEKVGKTFGEFLRSLTNNVNTLGFFKKLKAVVKARMKEGVEDAEKELEIDIGVRVGFDRTAEALANRQLDGFYIEGKRWKGLKGVAVEVQRDVGDIVRDGIVNKSGTKQIKKEVKGYMTRLEGGVVEGEVTEGRAMRIARTESNRFRNAGKLQAYKDSDVVKGKKWSSVMDGKTSGVCENLNGQVVGLNEYFVDSETGKEYDHPPALPNCRSTIVPVLKKE